MRTARIQEVGYKHSTMLGNVLYIRMSRDDSRPMDWDEIWENFAEAYPGQWAAQFFPPREELVNEVNVYHLFVLEPGAEMGGLNINRRRPKPDKVVDCTSKGGSGW